MRELHSLRFATLVRVVTCQEVAFTIAVIASVRLVGYLVHLETASDDQIIWTINKNRTHVHNDAGDMKVSSRVHTCRQRVSHGALDLLGR